MKPSERVAVIGFGTMGTGISQACAHHGHEVTVLEESQAGLDSGRRRLEDFVNGGVDRGKLTAEEARSILSKVRGTLNPDALSGATLVIEAVYEDLGVKLRILRVVESVISHDAVIATNTSALSVTAIANGLQRQTSVAGLHFFNPAPIMPLVEVVRALTTSDPTVDRLLSFASSIQKQAVVVPDRPGFLVNRLLMPYLNDVIQAYDDGLASAEDMDNALELGLGYPMGPLALLDLIGLDVHLHATQAAYEGTLLTTMAPPPLLQRMVEAGFLGRKSGRGFRESSKERS